jgi:hypothetical protein
MNTTQINLRTLKAVALAASTEETRYYLNGVWIECRESHVTYVATNGHVLLCAQEELPALEPGAAPRLVGNWIVPNATIKSLKIKGKDRAAGDIAELRQLAPLQFILGESVFVPVDGSFPDWRRVVPCKPAGIGNYDKKTKTWDGVPSQFDPALVAVFGTFAKLMALGDSHINHAAFGDPHAVTFSRPNMERAFGILMPRRIDAPAWNGAPDWIQEPKAQEQQKVAA